VDGYGRLAAVSPLGSADWWAELLLSPAVAGVAAVAAAVLGLAAARARIRADQDLAREERGRAISRAAHARTAEVEDRDRAQWWVTYRWADRQVRSLDPDLMTRLAQALGATTQDPVRAALVDLLLQQCHDAKEAGGDD
jgi:hypothetical protein